MTYRPDYSLCIAARASFKALEARYEKLMLAAETGRHKITNAHMVEMCVRMNTALAAWMRASKGIAW